MKTIPENINKYYRWRPNPVPRNQWKARRPWTKVPTDIKSVRDYSVCSECGGTKNAFVEVSAGRKRMVPCPKCGASQGD